MESIVGRKTKGRQKLPMAMISNEVNRQVTFSKRRLGLFKKASDLATLCGVDVAILVFSPGGKAFSFGEPSFEEVFNTFLFHDSVGGAEEVFKAFPNVSISELNTQLTQVHKELEIERKRAQELMEVVQAGRQQCWWEAPFEELNLGQLEQLRNAMTELREKVNKIAENVEIEENVNMVAGNPEIEASQNLLHLQPALELSPHHGMTSLGHNFSYGGPSFY